MRQRPVKLGDISRRHGANALLGEIRIKEQFDRPSILGLGRAWRLSNTMDAGFCIATLDEALARHGTPKIFNTDQGALFTSAAFAGRLEAAGIAISMDGRGRFMDNIFVERWWRSIKYQEVHLKAYADGAKRETASDHG
jgi:transposase InsO family protein